MVVFSLILGYPGMANQAGNQREHRGKSVCPNLALWWKHLLPRGHRIERLLVTSRVDFNLISMALILSLHQERYSCRDRREKEVTAPSKGRHRERTPPPSTRECKSGSSRSPGTPFTAQTSTRAGILTLCELRQVMRHLWTAISSPVNCEP